MPRDQPESKAEKRKVRNKLAMRRLRKNGTGHAARDKQLAIILIGTAMELCFGRGWESKFSIEVRNKQPLGGRK